MPAVNCSGACVCVSGEEVNWVQCDGCELWFHLLCVGLGEDEVSEHEDYVCYQCKKGPSASSTMFSMGPLPQAKPRKVMPPKPRKPVDEAITKSYKDFLDELDMNEIGKSKLRTMEKSLSQEAAGSGDAPMDVEISDEEEEEVEEEEEEEVMMGTPPAASMVSVPSISPAPLHIVEEAGHQLAPPSHAAQGQSQVQMEEQTIVIS